VAQKYNKERKAHQFEVGVTVMYKKYLVRSKAQNISGKLLLRWSEPQVIAKMVNCNDVLLASLISGVIVRETHVCKLKAYLRTYLLTHSMAQSPS